MPNTGRFRRVERGLHRHVRSGELWFVGRQGGKVVWRRLRTHDLRVARATVAMLDSNTNGNTAIFPSPFGVGVPGVLNGTELTLGLSSATSP